MKKLKTSRAFLSFIEPKTSIESKELNIYFKYFDFV